MERELLTRNFMTGWVFVSAFLASWLPAQQWFTVRNITDYLAWNDVNYGALAAIVIAVLGSPIIGYIISAFVLVYMYLRFGDPYNFYSREMVERLVRRKYRRLRNRSGDPLCRGTDMFAYLVYSRGPKGLVEWGRRRHTTRFVGYNWTIAVALGLGFGSTLDWKPQPTAWFLFLLAFVAVLLLSGIIERGIHSRYGDIDWCLREKGGDASKRGAPKVWWPRYQPWSFVTVCLAAMAYALLLPPRSLPTFVAEALMVLISAAGLFLAFRASWEVEEVERLWVKDYLSQRVSLGIHTKGE